MLSKDGEGSGEAGRAEDSTRSKPDERVFKQRGGERQALPVQPVWGSAWGHLACLRGSLLGGQLFLGEKRVLEVLLSERTLTLLRMASLVDFLFLFSLWQLLFMGRN